VLTHVDAVRFWNSFDPGIFANLVLASFFRYIYILNSYSLI
jgi:hypothetical protein